jgi:hypothetical protein
LELSKVQDSQDHSTSLGGDFSFGFGAVKCFFGWRAGGAADGLLAAAAATGDSFFAGGLKKLNMDPFTGTAGALRVASLADVSAKNLVNSSSTDSPGFDCVALPDDDSLAFMEAV